MNGLEVVLWLFSCRTTEALRSVSAAPRRQISAEPARDPILAGGFDLSGELRAGWRFVEVDGSERQFDEDFNLDDGPVLLDLALEGERVAGAGSLSGFSLRALGIGEPISSYRGEADFGDWRTTGRFDRSEHVGNVDSELHSYDVERESAAFAAERRSGESLAGVEATWLERDGLSLGSRSVGFEFVEGFPVRRKETLVGSRARSAFALSSFDLDLSVGLEDLRTKDRRDFADSLPSFPGEIVSEDFEADTDGTTLFAQAGAGRDFAGGSGRIDAELSWRRTELEGGLQSLESGFFFDPSLPFERLTVGALDVLSRSWEGDVGLTYEFDHATQGRIRYAHAEERTSGLLDRTVFLDEMMGGPPSVSFFQDDALHTSAPDSIVAGLTRDFGERASVDVEVFYERNHIEVREVVEDVVIRTFDDTVDLFGGEVGLSFEPDPAFELDLSGGYDVRPTETADVGVQFTFKDERSSHVGIACRWKPASDSSLRVSARREWRDSDAFDSRSENETYSVGLTSGSPDQSADLSFTYRDQELEADTNFLFFDPVQGIFQVPVVVGFESQQRIWSASLSSRVLPAFRPLLSGSAVFASGEAAFDYANLRADLPFEVSSTMAIGLELSVHDFDARGPLEESSYQATMALVYLRITI